MGGLEFDIWRIKFGMVLELPTPSKEKCSYCFKGLYKLKPLRKFAANLSSFLGGVMLCFERLIHNSSLR